MEYRQEHKMLLQAIMHEGLLNTNKAKELVIKLFNDNKQVEIINQINKKLQPLNMEIKKAQCEVTGQLYWVFISTVLDEVTRFQTEFSAGQLALLRTIFSEIITSSNGCVQSIVCLNFCSSPDIKLSKKETEEFLNNIVEKKWLAYKDGYYYMGVRSIAELMPYFKATYESNLSTCCLCKQIIFHGEKCSNCETFIHLYCLKHFISMENPMKCPNCNTVISDTNTTDLENHPESSDEEDIRVSKRLLSKNRKRGS